MRPAHAGAEMEAVRVEPDAARPGAAPADAQLEAMEVIRVESDEGEPGGGGATLLGVEDEFALSVRSEPGGVRHEVGGAVHGAGEGAHGDGRAVGPGKIEAQGLDVGEDAGRPVAEADEFGEHLGEGEATVLAERQAQRHPPLPETVLHAAEDEGRVFLLGQRRPAIPGQSHGRPLIVQAWKHDRPDGILPGQTTIRQSTHPCLLSIFCLLRPLRSCLSSSRLVSALGSGVPPAPVQRGGMQAAKSVFSGARAAGRCRAGPRPRGTWRRCVWRCRRPRAAASPSASGRRGASRGPRPR